MGTHIGAFIIRQDVTKFTAQATVNFFKGVGFSEINERALNMRQFDTRKPDCIAVYKTNSFVIVVDSELTAGFYDSSSNNEIIKKTYQYFGKPRQIFAFEAYDSGDTYSFCIVTNGKVERFYRYTNDKTDTFGEPLNIELKLLHAKRTTRTDTNGDTYTYFLDPDTKEMYYEGTFPELLLYEVMVHEVGITPENVYESAVERKFFMKIPDK